MILATTAFNYALFCWFCLFEIQKCIIKYFEIMDRLFSSFFPSLYLEWYGLFYMGLCNIGCHWIFVFRITCVRLQINNLIHQLSRNNISSCFKVGQIIKNVTFTRWWWLCEIFSMIDSSKKRRLYIIATNTYINQTMVKRKVAQKRLFDLYLKM